MSRIADLLRKTRERERERTPIAAGVESGDNRLPQWMTDVDIPWQIGAHQRSSAASATAPTARPAVVALQRAAVRTSPPEVAEVVHRLFFSGDGKAIHRVLFSPVSQSNGKGDLARQIAEGLTTVCTGNVCLADLEFRRPAVDRHFGFQGRPGFSDIVMDPDSVFEVVHASPSILRLSVMPAGTRIVGFSPKLVDPNALGRLVTELSRFEYVVALTASLGEHRDAITLAPAFDGVVLVAESGTTDPGAVRAAARALSGAGIRLLGTIIDNKSTRLDADRYGA